MRIFGRTVPLWATFFPLALAVGGYWRWWDGRMSVFRADLGAALGPGMAADFGGFPYRLHAEAGHLVLMRAREDVSVQLEAERMTVDRQPAATALSVIGMAAPKLRIEVAGNAGAVTQIAAPSGRASVHADYGRLARLSAEFPDAHVALGILPGAIEAARLEVHVRETPVAPIALPTGPAMPVQAQVRLAGEGVRMDGGDPLGMEADIAVTAASPLRSAKGWAAQSGTVELRRLRLADKGGVVAEVAATVVPRGGVLEMAGTVTTVCPRAVLAALAHRVPGAPEYRARVAQRIAFGGVAGAVTAKVDEAKLGAWTVRAQEAACPVLRR